QWLPGCAGVESPRPLRKGVRFKARFGNRETEFEVVDFAPPTAFGLVERGERNGWKTLFRLDETAGSTAVTVRDVWAPRSVIAWLRGRLREKRQVGASPRRTWQTCASWQRRRPSNAAPISCAGSTGASDRFVSSATTTWESRSNPNTAVPPTALPPWNAQWCPRLSVLKNQPIPYPVSSPALVRCEVNSRSSVSRRRNPGA